MKDVIIPKSKIKRELIICLCFFVLAFAANTYAIIDYNAEWKELLTEIHWVILVSFGLYIVSWLIRLIFYLPKRLLRRK